MVKSGGELVIDRVLKLCNIALESFVVQVEDLRTTVNIIL